MCISPARHFFFKTVSEQQHEERGALRWVPENLNLARAVEIVKQNQRCQQAGTVGAIAAELWEME